MQLKHVFEKRPVVSLARNVLIYLNLFALPILLSGCITASDPKLIGNEGQVYSTGLVNQKVKGDGFNVSVWNIWKVEDGLPFAEQHCQKFGKTVSAEMRFKGITGYYTCKGLSEEQLDEIFELPELILAISELGGCIRENVMLLDDYTSDAETVAKAVSQTCTSSWEKLTASFIENLPNSSELSVSYKSEIGSTFNDTKIDKVIPYVLSWRSLVKRGWNERKEPTIEEMPDSLFPKGI